MSAQEGFSFVDILLRMVIRMTIAIEEMASTGDVGRKVFRQTITWSRFRFKDGRLFDQSRRCYHRCQMNQTNKETKKKKKKLRKTDFKCVIKQ